MVDHLSRTFAALADPTRRAILARLSKGEANVSVLAKPFLKEMSLPAVTKHLQVLAYVAHLKATPFKFRLNFNIRPPGLHYKRRSELNRSGNSRFRAARIR
ncbi:MAG TPA: helix-turn-helix domain-containing protein, partial [Planctomycetaceae bacterium]